MACNFSSPYYFVFLGVGHCGNRAEAEKGADWSESLG